MYQIDIADQQDTLRVDAERLRNAVETILRGEQISAAAISVAIVDDAEMTELHGRYLDLPEPTDVLSFVLEESPELLEGEVIASADTATASAPAYGWPAEDELLLYVVHGTLHLVGYDDTADDLRLKMREREGHYLTALGVAVPPRPSAASEATSTGAGQP